MGKYLYLKDVVTLQVDREKCVGCGMCLEVCPHSVLELADKKIFIADRDACMECGACAMNCPVLAISVQAGVGCAQAIISSLFGRKNSCNIDDESSQQTGSGSCC